MTRLPLKSKRRLLRTARRQGKRAYAVSIKRYIKLHEDLFGEVKAVAK